MTGPFTTGVLAHTDRAIQPHDVLTAWRPDLLLLGMLAIATVLYVRGLPRNQPMTRQRRAYFGAMVAIVVALMSPVEAVAGVLLTAHMIQHVLLIAVAAPLLAYAGPGTAILRGLPITFRSATVSARRSAGMDITVIRRFRHPLARWGALTGSLWLWHASLLYDGALNAEWMHRVEHVAFFAGAFVFWSVIVGPRHVRIERGIGTILVFLLVLQGVVLSALLTFSTSVWYDTYAQPAPGWNLDPLTDQHLAGLIMWFPTGLIYTGIGLMTLVQWIADSEREIERIDAGRVGVGPAR